MLRQEGEYIPPHMLVQMLRERITKANRKEGNENVHTSWQEPASDERSNELTADYSSTACPLRKLASPLQRAANDPTAVHTLLPESVNVSRLSSLSGNTLSKDGDFGETFGRLGKTNVDLKKECRNECNSSGKTSEVPVTIVPVRVYNNNNISNLHTVDWQGDTLATALPTRGILLQPDDRSLTTGNISNYYKVGADFINPHTLYTHHSFTVPEKGKLSTPHLERTLSHENTHDKMASHNSTNLNSSSKMRVRPVGDDYFMLTVEDTGITPQQLEQQMRDHSLRYPGSTAPHQRSWSAAGQPLFAADGQRKVEDSDMNTVPGQPFMVTWSENGLPRINMLSTPWLSNTLSRQRGSAANQNAFSVPPANQNTYSTPTLARDSGFQRTHPNRDSSFRDQQTSSKEQQYADVSGRSSDVDIPIYKIVANEPIAIPIRKSTGFSDNSEAPPTPPPRLRSRRNVSANPSLPQEQLGPSEWSRTLPVNSKSKHNDNHWGSYDPQQNNNRTQTRVNAPVPIDVRQVPPAGKVQVQQPSNFKNAQENIYGSPANNNNNVTKVYEPVTAPQRRRQGVPESIIANSHNTPPVSVSMKRLDRDDQEIPSFKISSSSIVPRYKETVSRPSKDSKPSKQMENNDQPPTQKSESGYLQKYLREVRSPSPARKTFERERGRQRTPRPSTRSRSRERHMRSPSPMPERSREIVFNDEIDWSDNDTSSKVNWDQISAVLRLVTLFALLNLTKH